MAEELFRQRQQEKIRTAEKAAEKTGDGQRCPFCGMPVKGTEEFCPHCGRPLAPYCTFCGAEMSPGEDSCPECGMSRHGVICPRCGTLNARALRHPERKSILPQVQRTADPGGQEGSGAGDEGSRLPQGGRAGRQDGRTPAAHGGHPRRRAYRPGRG